MGDYTGIHISLQFKPNVPTEIVAFMNDLVLQEVHPDNKIMQAIYEQCQNCFINDDRTMIGFSHEITTKEQVLAELDRSVFGISSYFDAWKQQMVTYRDDGAMWFRSWASVKEVPYQTLASLLEYLRPHLELADGVILLRTLYEESSVEKCVWYDAVTQKFMKGTGYKYHNPIEDSYSGFGFFSQDIDEQYPEPPKKYNPKNDSVIDPENWPSVTIQEALETTGQSLDKLKDAIVFCE